jgi:DNA polymerase II small subunit
MDPREILKFCIERGLLLDEEVLNLFSETTDTDSAKLIIEKLKSSTQKRIITKDTFEQNKERVGEFFLTLPEENQKKLEKLKIKLGLHIEISKEISRPEQQLKIPEDVAGVKVLSKAPSFKKKAVVEDLVKNFRDRFCELKYILQDHSELESPISINKLTMKRQGISIIGIVSDKRITRNGNMLLEVEDLPDAVFGFKGFGDKEILFVNDIIFPDSMLPERKKSPVEEYALFISDLQYGSKLFMENSFLKFINYLNGKMPNTPEIDKIKYLFIVGDLVSGVGVYQNQIKDLEITDIEEQYQGVAEEKYAWSLYDMKNIILTGNPAYINIGEKKNFSGFDILTYHGYSFPYYANTIPRLMKKALNAPEKIMEFLLKNRHLAPSYSSVHYLPAEEDELIIKKIPDIFVSGHTHKCAVSYYNNVLIVSNATWEEETEYQKTRGNQPDFCKVPMFNLNTRAMKILDFEEKE